jgi:hypothetical protein
MMVVAELGLQGILISLGFTAGESMICTDSFIRNTDALAIRD